jgi:uncharacterized repeat protein (TIGR01451 family)
MEGLGMASRYRRAPWKGLIFLFASLACGVALSGLFGRLVVAGAQTGDQAAAQSIQQPAAAGAAQATPQPAAPLLGQIVSSPALAGGSGLAPAASFWTDERIRSAKAYPLPSDPAMQDGRPAGPVGPAGWAPALPPDGPETDFLSGLAGRLQAAPQDSTYFNPNSYSLFPYRAVGRVYFTENGQAYACSASVIGEYAIWTAGHCVHAGNGDPNAWHTDWAFIPAYKDGTRPYGTWQAAYLYATSQWINGSDLRYDYGVAIVQPLNGLTIRQTVGALGFAWNQSLNQPRIDIGYPVKPTPPYNGQKQVISSASSAFWDTNQPLAPVPIGIVSQMQNGASGGPWMLNHAITTTAGYNLLNGQNSYIYSSQQAIYSPYFGEAAKSMYDCATSSTPYHKTCGSEAELALSQAAPSAVLPGQPFTYTLVVQNWGALDAAHLVLTDTLGPGTSIISASLTGGTCAWLNRNIFCTLAVFPRWEVVTATLAVKAPLQVGPTLNLAGARSDQDDYTPADNVGIPLMVMVGNTTYLPAVRK